MKDIILHQSMMRSWIILLGITIAFSLLTLSGLLVTINVTRNFLKHTVLFGNLILVLFTTITLGATVSGFIHLTNQQYQKEYTIKHTPISHYYDYTKEGQLITATRKLSAPDILKAKVTTKIISKDKTSYQVEYQNQYDSIPKSYLK